MLVLMVCEMDNSEPLYVLWCVESNKNIRTKLAYLNYVVFFKSKSIVHGYGNSWLIWMVSRLSQPIFPSCLAQDLYNMVVIR